MIIICENCKTRYKVADNVIDKPVLRVRCSKCNHRFIFQKPAPQEPALVLNEEMKADSNRIISISNQKGGVGKTSTTLNLGMSLAAMGKRVLLIDFDVQANLTILMGYRKTKSFYDILQSRTEDLTEVIEKTGYENLFLLPSNSRMALLKKKYLNEHNYEYLLRDRLTKIKDRYDHILIDTPPSIEFFTLNALVASNMVVIPTTCEYLSMHGINQITDIITVIKKEINRDIDHRILMTMYNAKNTASKVMFAKVRDKYGTHVFKTFIELDDKMQESHIVNVPVVQYDDTSSSARQYKNLAKEIAGENM
ncbi:MAG: AAA family ATPase [Thermodesulfobacteriota bacterium]